MAMKSISEEGHGGDQEAREHFFDWELFKFGLEVIVLLGFVYAVHLLIHMW